MRAIVRTASICRAADDRQHVALGLEAERPLEERARAITGACFAAARENADLVRLVFFGADSAAVELQERFAQANPVVEALAAMLEADIAAGRIAPTDPQIAARLLVGLVKNAVLEAFVLGDDEQAQRLEAATAQLFANALGTGVAGRRPQAARVALTPHGRARDTPHRIAQLAD